MKPLFLSAAILAASTVQAHANDYASALNDLVETQLAAWLQDSTITGAIIAQNQTHAGIAQDQIDALDQAWRSEVGSGASPMVDEVLARPASQLLKSLQEGTQGMVTEVFVMDNVGLNAAQSTLTSDFWQGDEDKWQKTFQMGAGAIHMSDVEFDESTQTYQTQVSLSIVDPGTNDVIGAATFGIDVSYLE